VANARGPPLFSFPVSPPRPPGPAMEIYLPPPDPPPPPLPFPTGNSFPTSAAPATPMTALMHGLSGISPVPRVSSSRKFSPSPQGQVTGGSTASHARGSFFSGTPHSAPRTDSSEQQFNARLQSSEQLLASLKASQAASSNSKLESSKFMGNLLEGSIVRESATAKQKVTSSFDENRRELLSFNDIDRNGDGVVDRKEWLQATKGKDPTVRSLSTTPQAVAAGGAVWKESDLDYRMAQLEKRLAQRNKSLGTTN